MDRPAVALTRPALKTIDTTSTRESIVVDKDYIKNVPLPSTDGGRFLIQ